MKRQNQLLFVLLTFICISATLLAAAPKEIILWPDGAPGDMKLDSPEIKTPNGHIRMVSEPTITLYLPPKEKANGSAIVICPGGGYGVLAFDHEGIQVAKWLNSIGIAGIILKYRHAPFKHPVPLLDAQHAISTVRYNAKKWNIDPAKIGILGFSAGGHLASSAATHFHRGKPNANNPVDKVSSRPDFAILCYPVITFTKDTMHRGSRNNLLGNNPDPELIKHMSSELQVTADTPPTFLVHSSDDRGVPPQNSIDFYLALHKAGVPAELHLYEKGGHGYGMVKGRCPAADDWPRRCEVWLKQRGIIK